MEMTVTSLEAREDMGAGELSERFAEALAYASKHHRTQFRKGSKVPYMSHLMSVSALVLEHGGTEDQAIAALLHDAVEDAPKGRGGEVLAEIRDQFGCAVASMVEACSDSLNETDQGKAPWPERKTAYIVGLRDRGKKSDEALLVTAADKIHNGSRIAADLRTYGPGFWRTFNASPFELLWYYAAVAAAVRARLGDSTVTEHLTRTVDDLFAAASEQDRALLEAAASPAATTDPTPTS